MAGLEVKPRKFYAFSPFFYNAANDDKGDMAKLIRDGLIGGSDLVFAGPFGPRNSVYADYIASGRPLSFLEDFLRQNVLPFYANTHNTNCVTALQTTMFRHEARDIVRNAVNASEHDAVLFTGSGGTGAVHKLINALDLEAGNPPVVFVSGMEHHSNLLPWRDLGADVVQIKEDKNGRVSLDDLRAQLSRFSSGARKLIGCFCAASNVTGALNDDLAITAVLHRQGALAFWDYATAAPYVNVDMNPAVAEDADRLCSKDAIFFSVHKFVGGVQTPGVLVAKKALMRGGEKKPNGAGGGSVFYVREEEHRYLKDPEVREEGGTPAIVESVRAGLVLQLKEAVGSDFILRREEELVSRANERLKNVKNLHILGNQSLPHLPILSFLTSHPGTDTYLHHNFLAAVLNDVFGIQARGGCACAGPYAQHLLGMDQTTSARFEDILAEDERLDRTHLRRGQSEYSSFEILRPGFVRLNLPWFSSDAEIEYVLEAVALVAEHAWKLLPQYRFNNETGEWKHFGQLEYKERMWLGNISYTGGKFNFWKKHDLSPRPVDFSAAISEAMTVFNDAKKQALKRQVPDQTILFSEGEAKSLRWFMLPSEAKDALVNESSRRVGTKPFIVRTFSDEVVDGAVRGSYFKQFSLSEELLSELRLKQGGKKLHWLQPTEDKKQEVQSVKAKKESVAKVPVPEENILDEPEADCNDGLCVLRKDRPPLLPEQTSTPCKWRPPTKDIFKPFLEAMEDFSMIKAGDRVLVCLSGGKDSLTLLHTLKQYQFYAEKTHGLKFELGAVTVDPGSSAYDPRPLIPYLAGLGVPYLYEEQAIMAQALAADCSSICAFCSRLKRGRIYAAARRDGWNVLAMGQHLDDLAESFLMSTFHNGRLRTMKANYSVKEGDLRVIRPFVYVREKSLRDFAETKKLPVIPENCPACFESPKERHRTKQLLAQQELLFPRLYWSLKSAMMPVMSVDRTGLESKLFGSGKKGKLEEEEEEEEEDL